MITAGFSFEAINRVYLAGNGVAAVDLGPYTSPTL